MFTSGLYKKRVSLAGLSSCVRAYESVRSKHLLSMQFFLNPVKEGDDLPGLSALQGMVELPV